MKSCTELGKRHQLSHDENIDKCLYCHKTKREILDDLEAFDEPNYSRQKIGSEAGL